MTQDTNESIQLETELTFYLDDRTTSICSWVLFTVVCQIINTFGIVTNIINIVCFVKQGLTDSMNISLLGLSVSDLASLITSCGICFFYTPAVIEADFPFESTAVMYLIFGMPHFAFTRVSSCITALITMERCLSVVAPLKVKRIITPRRTAVSVGCIFLVFTFCSTPIFVVNRLEKQFSISRNKTIVGLTFSDNKQEVEMFTFTINNFFIPFCAFVIVAVCTFILTSQLRNNSKWRRTTINDAQAQKMLRRNKKVAVMVISISTLYISCFVPTAIIMVAIAFEPGLSINGKYFNASKMLAGCILILESVNSTANIIIYYQMSTNYRNTFRLIFFSEDRHISHKVVSD